MNVHISKPYGYCSGVKLAFEKIKYIRKLNPGKNIYVLGQLVHNDDALKELDESGVSTLLGASSFDSAFLDKLNNDDVLVFTAHGHDEKLDEILKARKITFYDTACPKVKEIAQIIKKQVALGKDVIYLGKKNHPETIGATSIDAHVHLYDINSKFDFSLIKDDSPIVINQTTLAPYEIEGIIKDIKTRFPNAIILNSICFSSRYRQDGVENLPKNTDVIFVIGSPNSNNTTTLFKYAQKLYPQIDVFRIANVDDLKKSQINLHIYKNAAIISGASTPQSISDIVADYLKTI